MLFAVALHSVANDYFAEKQAEQDIYNGYVNNERGYARNSQQSPDTLFP